jgi:hypothetical protein
VTALLLPVTYSAAVVVTSVAHARTPPVYLTAIVAAAAVIAYVRVCIRTYAVGG